MSVVNPLQVNLSNDALRVIESKVASGEFESVDAVLEESVLHMNQADARIEEWANTEGLQRLAEYDADPTKGLSWEQVRAKVINRADLRKAG